MTVSKVIRSPFFYVGDKYKLMPQISQLFPVNISTYIEPFLGGGSSFLNSNADRYILNDIDSNIIDLHKMLLGYAEEPKKFINYLISIIHDYKLSCSYIKDTISLDLKKQYPKTYYAKYNKDSYQKLKEDYNNTKDIILLYILLLYGFNHMFRFNSKGYFNLPVGNVDFNKNVYNSLENYLSFIKGKEIYFYNEDYISFLSPLNIGSNDFIYLDPPYLISNSEYNKLWNKDKEEELYDYLIFLDKKGYKWGITNLLYHKNNKNERLGRFINKFNFFHISSNYISFNDNSIKSNSQEVFVTNYGNH